tara:strand:+ start:2404 stop:3153 length:750 start_codon:yes stop_codon:yes gene_type:complete
MRYPLAGDIINRVALETGLITKKLADPFTSDDANMTQLIELLAIAGQEMVSMHNWEVLVRNHQIVTQSTDSGDYPLPDNFSHMIDQTGWERKSRVPLFGPLSAQDWSYLKGRKLANYTIYASFRIQQGQFTVFPNDPIGDGWDINFEYISRDWVEDSTNPGTFIDTPKTAADTILYEYQVISRYLKVKYLMAKNLDATAAQDDFNQVFMSWTGKDTGAEILNAGHGGRRYPYLDTYRNTGDSNYGSSFP